MNRIIDLWQSATGDRVKDRPVRLGPAAPAPVAGRRRAPPPRRRAGSGATPRRPRRRSPGRTAAARSASWARRSWTPRSPLARSSTRSCCRTSACGCTPRPRCRTGGCAPSTSGAASVSSRGSGLLVGPRQVLTAAHNVYDAEGNRPDSLHVAPARNGARMPFGRFEAVAFTTTSRYITNPAPGNRFDIALVTLGADASAATVEGGRRRPLGHWGDPRAGAGNEPARPGCRVPHRQAGRGVRLPR